MDGGRLETQNIALCRAPPLRGALYKKWGGTIKNFFRRFAPDGYVPHHFHIRSGALGKTCRLIGELVIIIFSRFGTMHDCRKQIVIIIIITIIIRRLITRAMSECMTESEARNRRIVFGVASRVKKDRIIFTVHCSAVDYLTLKHLL